MIDAQYMIKKAAKMKNRSENDSDDESEEEDIGLESVSSIDDASLGVQSSVTSLSIGAMAQEQLGQTAVDGGAGTGEGNEAAPLKALESIANESMSQVGDESSVGSNKSKKVHMISKILPPIPYLFPWRQHAMVAKLVGPPLICKSNVSNLDVNLLGKKSFWLESRSQYLETRWKSENEQIEVDREKWMKLPLHKQMLIKNSVMFKYPFKSAHPPYYQPNKDLPTRMKMVEEEVFRRNNQRFQYGKEDFEEEEVAATNKGPV